VANSLLVFNINFKISYQNNASVSPYTFLATAELAGLHVAFHNVDPVPLIKRDAGDLIKAYHVILANQAALTSCIIDKHASNCCLTSRNQVGVGRDLLEKVTFAGTARAKFNQIVITLYERQHAKEQCVPGSLGE
jgi:hypothetical protein